MLRRAAPLRTSSCLPWISKMIYSFPKYFQVLVLDCNRLSGKIPRGSRTRHHRIRIEPHEFVLTTPSFPTTMAFTCFVYAKNKSYHNKLGYLIKRDVEKKEKKRDHQLKTAFIIYKKRRRTVGIAKKKEDK